MAWTDLIPKALRPAPKASARDRLPRDASLQLGERLAAAFRSNVLRLLPYLDTTTEETAEHRAAYRKAHAEPAIKAALLSKLFAVGCLDLQMEPVSERPRDLMVSDLVKDTITNVKGGLGGLVLDIALGGTLEGNSLGEKIWVPDSRKKWRERLGRPTMRLERLHAHDPEDYDLKIDEYNHVREVVPRRNPGDGSMGLGKFVHYIHLPLYSNPLGTSDIRANYREFWIIDTAMRFHAIGLERFVLPYFKVQHDDREILTLLGNAVKHAKNLGYIQAPTEAIVEALQMSWNSAIFENAIRLYTQRIFLGITGAFLQAVEGAATGSRSIGEVHQSSSELVIWYLASTVAEVINDQIIPDIVRWNFLDADPPRCSLVGVNAEEQLKMLDLYAKAQGLGLELSKKEVRKKIGFQAPLDEADALKPPAPTAGMGGLPFSEAPPKVAQQTDYTCGPAALLAALQHFGLNGHTEESLAKACGAEPANGTAPERLSQVARNAGLSAELHTSLTLNDLREAAEAGRLVICAIQDGPPAEEAALEAGHYVVVYGANSSAITYEDPAGGSLEVVYPEEFLESWVDTGPRGVVYRRLGIVLDRPAVAAWDTVDDPAFAAAEAKEQPGTSPTPSSQPAATASAPSDEFALVGPDGRKVAQLLARSKQQGVQVLGELCEQAFRRVVKNQGQVGQLFTEDERAELTEALAASIASADLLGRSRIRIMQERAEAAQGRVNFCEEATNFKAFDEQPIRPLPPQKALAYFTRLVPKLGKNPGFDDQMRRTAFTMAEATESTLLTKVQDLIRSRLEEGLATATPQALDDLLVAAGVTPKNPQYAELVMRTNMADAYNQGAGDELRHPDVIEAFPAWEYLAVARPGDKTHGDGRNRPHHLARNGNLYPSDLTFGAVRGDDISEKANCRCTFAPVTRAELSERLARGQKVQRFSESKITTLFGCTRHNQTPLRSKTMAKTRRVVFSFDERSLESLEKLTEQGRFSSMADTVRESRQDRKNFCQEGPNAGKPGPCPDPSKQDSGSGQKKSKEQARKEHFQKQFPASARAPVAEKLAKLEAALGHATGAVAGGAKKAAAKAVGLVVSNTRAWIGNANGIYKEELAKADPGTKAKMLAVAKGTARVYFATYEKNKERYGKGVAAIMQAVHTSLSFPVMWSLRVGTAGLVPGVGTVAHYAVGKAVEGTAALMHKGLLKAGVKKGLHLGFSEDDPLAYLNAVAADLDGLKPTDFKSFDLDAIVTDLKAQRAAAGLSEVTDEQILAALLPLLPEA